MLGILTLNNMTPEEFIKWLEGYLDGVTFQSKEDVKDLLIQVIKTKLSQVELPSPRLKSLHPDPPYENPYKGPWTNPYIINFDSLPDEVPYGDLCSCNPKNGGSGICGCVMGNKMVPNPMKYKTGQDVLNGTTTTTTWPLSGNITYIAGENLVYNNVGKLDTNTKTNLKVDPEKVIEVPPKKEKYLIKG
jgi:hypothetical protein